MSGDSPARRSGRWWCRRVLAALLALAAGALLTAGGWLVVGLQRPLDPVPRFGASHDAVAITDVTVVDVVSGARAAGQTVLVARGLIASVGPAGRVGLPPGVHRIDGRGKFLIPGLWDAHIHTLRHSPRLHFPLLLAHGVTSVRNLGDGCAWTTDPACVPDAVEWDHQGDEVAPLIPRIPLWASHHVEALPPPGGQRALVAALKARGDTLLKLQLPDDTPAAAVAALVAEATRQDLPVAGHLPRSVDLLDAAAGRWLSVEHGDQLLVQCEALGAARGWAAGDCGPLLAHLARQDTAFVPTFVASTAQDLRLGTDPAAEEARLAFVPAPLADLWRAYRVLHRAGSDAGDEATARARHQAVQGLTLAAQRAGVPVLAGTDALDPFVLHGPSLHDELEELVAAGLTPLQALQAATVVPARHSGVGAWSGRVAEGLRAELVLLDADPVRDVRAVRRIDTVLARGLVFDAAERERMLRFVADQARSHALAARMWRALLGGGAAADQGKL